MRLITRSDFDGLVCAVLLKEIGMVDSYRFVHPKDVQDGKIEATEMDIVANIPYLPGCGMWFDHHVSEKDRKAYPQNWKGASYKEKSAGRVIYDYFGGSAKFPADFEEMMNAVDKTDSGNLTTEEILHPQRWVLLSFIMDPRTGLGRYKDYRISNYQLMEDLIEMCRTKNIEEILVQEDVRERLIRYHDQEKAYREMVLGNSRMEGRILVIDLRQVEEIITGNRFVEYSLFPNSCTSIRVLWGLKKQNTVFAVGHSILNRSSSVNIGALLLPLGGGGHFQVGTCQVENEKAEEILRHLIDSLNQP
jgi:nanoRNase/pAp phosphatase (c-di-AMP/oligoRNAs hydrolase)